MTQPQTPRHGVQAASAAQRLDQARERFEAAWNEALKGGAQPDLETYLGDCSAPEQSVLRDQLETVDKQYRQRLARGTEMRDQTTIGYTPPASADTPVPGPSATIDYG